MDEIRTFFKTFMKTNSNLFDDKHLLFSALANLSFETAPITNSFWKMGKKDISMENRNRKKMRLIRMCFGKRSHQSGWLISEFSSETIFNDLKNLCVQ